MVIYNFYYLQDQADWVKIATIVMSLCFVVFFAIGPGRFIVLLSDQVGTFSYRTGQVHFAIGPGRFMLLSDRVGAL